MVWSRVRSEHRQGGISVDFHTAQRVCTPACAHTHTHQRGEVLGTAELTWPPAQVSQESGVEELGSQAGEAGLRGSSRSYWSPGVGHRGLHGEGLAHSHREGRSGGSFSTPGRGPPLASHISPSPLSQRTHSAPCVLGPGKPVSFFSLKCLLHTSGSLTHWETVWASRVAQG